MSIETLPLFEGYEPTPPVEPVNDDDSADVRRTKAQRQRIREGFHPLANIVPGLRLHPDVQGHATVADFTGPSCGTCALRQLRSHHGRTYAKCQRMPGVTTSNSAASDCRAWWPACPGWQR